MSEFKVLHISNNIDEYPECAKDSEEHPGLVAQLNDEYGMFILDDIGGGYYPAAEFFDMYDRISEFSSADYIQRLKDELQIATTFIKSIKTLCGTAENAKDEHLSCWTVVAEAPTIVNNRIMLTAKDETFLALVRTKK